MQARGLNACPAAPEAVGAFIADETSNGAKVATITRRIAAIRYAHALQGVDPLPTRSEAVRATMKSIRRTRGAAQVRKAPATHGIIADMIACCPDTLRGTATGRSFFSALPAHSGGPNWQRSPSRISSRTKPACGSLSAAQ